MLRSIILLGVEHFHQIIDRERIINPSIRSERSIKPLDWHITRLEDLFLHEFNLDVVQRVILLDLLQELRLPLSLLHRIVLVLDLRVKRNSR